MILSAACTAKKIADNFRAIATNHGRTYGFSRGLDSSDSVETKAHVLSISRSLVARR